MAYHDQVIDELGVSKILGHSVLTELDLRATNKATNLGVDASPKVGGFSGLEANRYESTHTNDFQRMESIQSHYAAQKTPVAYPQPGKPAAGTSVGEPTMVDTLETPKRVHEGSSKSTSKRRRDLNGGARDNDSAVYSPVSDVTRRIRRLRVRSQQQTPRENQAKINAVRNTPLSGPPPSQLVFDGKPQATFAKPTFTSINRESKPGAIFSRLKKTEESDKTRAFRRGTARNQLLQNAASATQSTTNMAPSSVFQRLYTQSTISRSNSSNTISHTLDSQKLIPNSKATLPKKRTSYRNPRQ
ncbi:LADA_0D02322g1_1 [Lachancea dasiensis]|uniref:LADA_0D02322g1_1 n=1 Tax=Lachancea dasiensis TaxID=1072105 RepID=A0A1G4J466_9SACH|nr:LADA_0D02322g1_1 [Lachancea dasiensis]